MSRIQRFYILSLLLLFFMVFQLVQPLPGSAEENPCDPDLEQSATDPLGYKLRGDRCEGRYILEVGSTILFPVSLTAVFEDYDLTSDKDLLVEWAPLPDRNVRLRAHSLRRPPYYRMDTARPSNNTTYNWPTDILSSLEVSHRDLGVIGWMTSPVGGTEQEVFLPLRISQKGSARQSYSYTMILWPGKELTEVYISLAPVADGSLGEFIKDGEALEYGYYPAEQGIEFEISGMQAPGVYYLEIGAELESGGVVTIKHWFYHAG